MSSINNEAFGAPSIRPTTPTRGIPKTVFKRSSAPSVSDMILMDGDEGLARDAALVRSGKCEYRTGGWPEQGTKTAANGLMLAELSEGRTGVLIATTVPEFSSSWVLALGL